MSIESTSAKRLNSTALPSITGMAAAGLSPLGQLQLLAALLVVAAAFAPWAIAAALRISTE
ncbi:hypothetical protein D3C83_27510 [compost metagenome]